MRKTGCSKFACSDFLQDLIHADFYNLTSTKIPGVVHRFLEFFC